MTIVTLPPDYKPSQDEEYMNERQLEYFRQKLINWRAELVKNSEFTLQDLKESIDFSKDAQANSKDLMINIPIWISQALCCISHCNLFLNLLSLANKKD